MNYKYRVVIGWRCDFVFDDAMQAMEFLKTALEHKTDENSENIRLEVVEPEEQDEEEEAEDGAV